MNLLATQTTDSSSSGPFSGVGDFFSSGYFTAIERISGLFVIAIWLALAFWTAKDARRRIDDQVIVSVCVSLPPEPPTAYDEISTSFIEIFRY